MSRSDGYRYRNPSFMGFEVVYYRFALLPRCYMTSVRSLVLTVAGWCCRASLCALVELLFDSYESRVHGLIQTFWLRWRGYLRRQNELGENCAPWGGLIMRVRKIPEVKEIAADYCLKVQFVARLRGRSCHGTTGKQKLTGAVAQMKWSTY
jgi:hypothetical protein